MSTWLAAVATEYVSLRSEYTIKLPDSLDLTGIGLFDTSQLRAKLAQRLVPASTPSSNPLNISRSDLAETAAYMLLERVFRTEIAYKPVRDRELIQLPGRGIDAIGIEHAEKMLIVLCENKFSDENSKPKPPQVVDSSRDGLRQQHIGHIAENVVTASKIWDCARRAKDTELQQNLFAAALYLEAKMWDQIDIVSCCVLVRPSGRHHVGDFGSFKGKPGDYSPAHVRFLVWSLPGKLDEILSGWDVAVRSAQAAA